MGKNAQRDRLWLEAPILLALARSKSFLGAGEDLGIDRTTVVRRLEKLEAQLSTQLFERLSGKLELTPNGRRILSIVERAEQELSELQPDDADRRIRYGKVRVSMSPHVMSGFAAQMNKFVVHHPEIFVEFTTSDRRVDLFKYEADIALRIGTSPPDTLHSIDLGPVHFGLYQRSDELGPPKVFWSRAGETELSAQMRQVNDEAIVVAAIDGVTQMRDMILAGGGAGVMPKFLGDCDPRLVLCSVPIPLGRHRISMNCLPEQRSLRRVQIVMKNLSLVLAESMKEFGA